MPSLADVADISPGFDRTQARDLDEVISFVAMASVSEVSGAVTSEEPRPLSDVLKGFTAFQDRDILVAKITPCFENGKIAHARIQRRLGFGSTEFHVIRPNAAELDDRYLFHFLRQPHIREVGQRRMTGSAGQRRVPKAFLAELDVPLPHLPEQRRIATILDKADALRAKRREAIATLNQLLQSVFLEMFGDPVTNPKGWEKTKSADIFLDKPRIGTTRPATGSGVTVVRVGEVGAYEIAFEKCSRAELNDDDIARYSLAAGDSVIARAIGSEDQLGKCSYFAGASEVVCIDSHVMRLRPDPRKCDSIWFNYLLRSSGGKRLLQSGGGATAVQFNINTAQVSALDVPLPPLESQRAFRKLFERARIQHQSLYASEGRLGDIFAALQQRAFSGAL